MGARRLSLTLAGGAAGPVISSFVAIGGMIAAVALLPAQSAAAASTASGTGRAGPACTVTWTGAAGDQQWTTAKNWSPARVPGTKDIACVPASYDGPAVQVAGGTNVVAGISAQGAAGLELDGGSLELARAADASSIAGLEQTAGTLTVDSGVKLGLTGDAVWDGGVLAGAGTTTLTAGSDLTLLGATLTGKFVNDGAIDWQGGLVCLENPAVLTNSGTFTMTADGQEIAPCNGAVSFENTATGTISAGATPGQTIDIGTPFDNAGKVAVSSGTLELGDGDSATGTDAGSYSLASGSELDLSGGTRTLTSAAKITGSGTVSLNSTLVLAGQSLANLDMTGGQTEGAFTVTGSYVVTGGTAADVAKATTTTIAKGATMVIDTGETDVIGHNIVNDGTISWAGGGMCLGNGAHLTNNGTFDLTADNQYIQECGGSAPAFTNAAGATVVRAGTTGTCSYIDVPFDNAGTVTVSSGNVELGQGNSATGTDTGSYSLARGTELQLTGGSRTLTSAAKITGAGTVDLAATLVLAGQSLANLQQSGGQTEGPFKVTGTYVLTGGTMTDLSSATTTTIAAGATLITEGAEGLDGHNLVNDGTWDWRTGGMCMGDGAVFTNNGTWDITAAGGDAGPCGGAAASVVNGTSGTILVNSAADPTEKFSTTDDGDMDDDDGDMDVDNSFTFTATASYGATFAARCPELIVGGKAKVTGKLAIHTRKGFKPKKGESCSIISAPSGLTGKFKKVTGTKAGKGLSYAVGYTATGVTLTVK
jgi:hypothetical protein